MRLDPIYLVAPERASALTRRQVVRVLSTCVAAGVGVGFCSGFMLRARNPMDARLADPLVAWATRLADDPAPAAAEELARHAHGLRYALQATPHSDSLWRGWARAASHVLEHRDEAGIGAAPLLLSMFDDRPADILVPRAAVLVPRLREVAR